MSHVLGQVAVERKRSGWVRCRNAQLSQNGARDVNFSWRGSFGHFDWGIRSNSRTEMQPGCVI